MKKLLLVGMVAIGFARQATAMYQNIPKSGTRVKQIKERIKLSQEQEEYEQGQDWKSLQPLYYLELEKYQNGMFSGIRDYVGWLTYHVEHLSDDERFAGEKALVSVEFLKK